MLNRIHLHGAYLHLLLADLRNESSLESRHLALVERWVKGVLEQQTELDNILKPLVRGDFNSLPSDLQELLRVAAYQLIFLDFAKPAGVVSESVDLARQICSAGMASLTNAVLRKVTHNSSTYEKSPLVTSDSFYGHPQWIYDRWVKQFGVEAAISMCQANNTNWPIGLRVNTLKCSLQQLQARLSQQGVETIVSEVCPDSLRVVTRNKEQLISSLPSFKDGDFLIQDESSALVASILGPKPGQLVLDLCSAPGGKTCVMAMLMANQGKLIALDSRAKRLKLVTENCTRLGINCVEILVADAAEFQIEQKPDCILLDAPCSGLGTLGRKVDIRWTRKEVDLVELQVLQRKLISRTAQHLRPGSRFVYSTCSVDIEENEGVIEWFLENNSSFELLPLPEWLPPTLKSNCGRYMRTFPNKHNCAGAFAALIGRS